MKKIISLILAFVITVYSVPLMYASADEGPFTEDHFAYAEKIASAVSLGLDSYAFPEGVRITAEELRYIMCIVYYKYPMLFNISGTYNFSYTNDANSYIVDVQPVYAMTPIEYASAKTEVERWIDGVVSLTDSTFTPIDYALFFYDYLAMNFEYDTSNANNAALQSRTAYSMIKTGKGVCQAYTALYTLLLNEVGVETSFAHSDSEYMNHVWNLVKLDGKWYHVDVTWGDPTGTAPGTVNHGYFLLSDRAISTPSKKHHDWISPYACTSDKYDGEKIGKAESAVAKVNGSYYYISNGDLYVSRTNPAAGVGTKFMELDLVWHTWDSSGRYYLNNYSTVMAKGGKLYISGPTEIYEVDPATKAKHAAYKYNGNDGYIYGFMIDMGTDGVSGAGLSDGKIVLNIATSPSAKGKRIKAKLSAGAPVLMGDTDGNGKVTLADVSLMIKYIAEWDITLDKVAADYNKDGRITLADASLVMKKIAGWAV